MSQLTIVIANYNEKNFVEDCLNNLYEIKQKELPDLKVVVKDQASTDGSAEIIKEKFPWVIFIGGDNGGLSKAYNLGYKATDTEYVLFLGMDAYPTTNSLSEIMEYFEKNSDVGAATCKVVQKDGSLDMDAHRSFPTPWVSLTRLLGLGKIFPRSNLFNHYFLPGENMNEPHEIDLCISHYMFIRRKVLDEINGFDEDFFLYGEDVDVCYRIKQVGWKIMYLPQWECLHLKGGSIGIRKTTRDIVKRPLEHRLKMQKLSTEAMQLFVEKHYKDKYPPLIIKGTYLASSILGKIRVFMESLKK
ncbi:glycosyltransferase family 2 protein [Patescibacteria group bacterium]|nr:glycosyltransferase family 2 protein [Patescibacteria group bacterium]